MQPEQGTINIDALSNAERVIVADMLVNSVQDESGFTEEDKALLRARIEDAKNRSGAYISWEEARKKLFASP